MSSKETENKEPLSTGFFKDWQERQHQMAKEKKQDDKINSTDPGTSAEKGKDAWKGRMDEKDRKNRGSELSEEEWSKRKKRAIFIFIVTVILVVLLLLLMKGCSNPKPLPDSIPEYEEGQETGHGDGKAQVQRNRLNLAVMRDYEVTKKKQDFYFAYADQNYYEIEMSIRDDGKEVYRTKRIRPGTQVGIPGYVFLPKGKSDLSAVIVAYDPKTHDLISEAVTMEFTVTKK